MFGHGCAVGVGVVAAAATPAEVEPVLGVKVADGAAAVPAACAMA